MNHHHWLQCNLPNGKYLRNHYHNSLTKRETDSLCWLFLITCYVVDHYHWSKQNFKGLQFNRNHGSRTKVTRAKCAHVLRDLLHMLLIEAVVPDFLGSGRPRLYLRNMTNLKVSIIQTEEYTVHVCVLAMRLASLWMQYATSARGLDDDVAKNIAASIQHLSYYAVFEMTMGCTTLHPRSDRKTWKVHKDKDR